MWITQFFFHFIHITPLFSTKNSLPQPPAPCDFSSVKIVNGRRLHLTFLLLNPVKWLSACEAHVKFKMFKKKDLGFLENKKNTLCFKLKQPAPSGRQNEFLPNKLIFNFLNKKINLLAENPDQKPREIR
jgi:hypothetical protein